MILQVVTCSCCGESFQKKDSILRQNFRRYSSKETGYWFHSICKKCEDKQKIEREWEGDKLRCHLCGQYLPKEQFGVSDHYPYRDNRDARCKKCRNWQSRENKKRYSGEQSLLKMLQMRFLGARERAQRYNIPFNITKQYLKELWDKQEGLCAISAIPMTYIHGKGRTITNVSIDQINPKEGYTIGNIQLVCMAVNQMKSDLSMKELHMFCKAILENKDQNAKKWNHKKK